VDAAAAAGKNLSMSLCATNAFSPLGERNLIYPLICVEERGIGENDIE